MMADITSTRPIRLGLVGCGDFGEYCMETYAGLDGVEPVAAADNVRASADRVAKRFGVVAIYDAAELIARDDVDLVHLATPPSSHHSLATAAVAAGKHVLCEKPLAVELAHADEMVAAAGERGVILPVNFVLRHSPVAEVVKAVIDSGVLGQCLHGSFENFASDGKLHPKHWFWDKAVSGGIFVEHAVHFFDLYAHWLGDADLLNAHAEVRAGSTAEDRVMCLLRYPSGATVNFYHGFDQPSCLDRQNHHLLFEIGDMYVYGWIPETLTITAAVDDERLAELQRLCPGCEIETIKTFDSADRQTWNGRWIDRHVTRIVRVSYDSGFDKDDLYRHCIAGLMADQLAYLRDPAHVRRVTEQAGRYAVALATEADRLATA